MTQSMVIVTNGLHLHHHHHSYSQQNFRPLVVGFGLGDDNQVFTPSFIVVIEREILSLIFVSSGIKKSLSRRDEIVFPLVCRRVSEGTEIQY